NQIIYQFAKELSRMVKHRCRVAFALCLTLTFTVITVETSSGVPYPFDPDTVTSSPRGVTPQPSAAAVTGDIYCLLDSMTVTTSSSDGGSDIWGWQAPDGREYAIMGVTDGFVFVDVATGQIVQRVIDDCGNAGSWRDFKTYQHYCYAVTECSGAGRGVQIIDMAGLPNSIRDLGLFATTATTHWHNIGIDTVRGFAYLASQNDGFEVLDLSNPEQPVSLGFVNTGGCHDLYADNDTVWVAESFQPFFSVWDMTNKGNPTRIAHVSIPNAGFVHEIWVNADRTLAITTEETPGKTVKIWDIQNLGNVQLLGEYLGPSNLAHNAYLIGDTAYLSHYQSGVVALDLTDPTNPVEIDRFDTYPPGENSGFAGCWGIFPFTSSGKIYASNLSGGVLFVFGDAAMGADNSFGPAPLTVQFDSRACQTVLATSWDFGDGGSSSMAAPQHTYSEAGLYTVNLELQTTTDTFNV
ncbi:MAG: choice-of-anchor B family protein, partial [Candidatus Zixiibacteriota bacterium]